MTEATTSADAGNVATAATAEAAADTTAQTTTSTTATTSWRDALPEDIRANPSLAKFETQEGMAKSYLNLERMLGTEKVPVPKAGDDESWARWDKAAGVPDKPDGYGFEAPKELPPGLHYVPEVDQRIAAAIHKAGVSKERAPIIRDEVMKIAVEMEQAKATEAESQRATQEMQLKTEFGRAYDQKVNSARLALKEYAGDEFIAFLEQTKLGDHPAMVKAFAKVAEKTMGENQLIGTNGQREAAPAELDAQIADFRQKHTLALFDKSHPDHALRTAEYTALFARRHPENG